MDAIKLLDELAGFVAEHTPDDHAAGEGWGLLERLRELRGRLAPVVKPGSRAAGAERPRHCAAGGVAGFDVTVRVDTKQLANVVSETDHDVMGVGEAHTHEHAMVVAYLNRRLEGDLVVLEAKPQVTINGGNNGFHVCTVVADGYGQLIAETERGEELAAVRVTGKDPDFVKFGQELMAKVLAD